LKTSTLRSASPVRAYWLSALVFGLVGVAVAFAASMAATPQYEAHARLFVSTTGGAPMSNASYQETAASQQIALSLAKLISTEVVTERVVRSMHLDMSPSELSSKVEATVVPETVLIDLTVTDTSPTAAREIANSTAFEFSDFVDTLILKTSPSVPKPQVTLVQPAATPNAPVSPNTSRNLGLGLVAGLAAGLVVANLRERANKTVRDVRTLEQIVGEPTLGSIPPSRSRGVKSAEWVADDEWAAEGYREIRTNLQHSLGESPSRIVSVTSAGLREGKTTTALGIAIALSDAGHRVVVVDADLRGADLSNVLGLTDSPGLTEFLEEKLAFDDVVHPSPFRGIDAIPSGHASRQPSELLTSETAGKAYRLLSERYDYVVIDTPAVLALSDAAVVAARSDGVVLVARHADVVSIDLESAVANLQKVGARILGSVFTYAPVSEPRRRSLKARRRGRKGALRPRRAAALKHLDACAVADAGLDGAWSARRRLRFPRVRGSVVPGADKAKLLGRRLRQRISTP
jgi:polysaccharide biosynthesis transport protein